MARNRRCVNCNEPLGDSEAVRVTGKKSGNVFYVHRPSTPGRASMCFRYGAVGADVVTIEQVVPVRLDDPATEDVFLRQVLGGEEYRWHIENPRRA